MLTSVICNWIHDFYLWSNFKYGVHRNHPQTLVALQIKNKNIILEITEDGLCLYLQPYTHLVLEC